MYRATTRPSIENLSTYSLNLNLRDAGWFGIAERTRLFFRQPEPCLVHVVRRPTGEGRFHELPF